MRLGILQLFLLLPSLGLAAELDGYPFDTRASKASYVCNDGPQFRVPYSGAEFPIYFEVCSSNRFSDKQRTILLASASQLIVSLGSEELFACWQKKQGKKSIQESFQYQVLLDPLGLIPGRQDQLTYGYKAELFISTLDPKSERFSYAYPNFFHTPVPGNAPSKHRQYNSIAIRADLLDSTNHVLGDDRRFWLTQIAFAYLANIGWEEAEQSVLQSAAYQLVSCVLETTK